MGIYKYFTGTPLPKRQLRPFLEEQYNFQNKEKISYAGKIIKIEILNFIMTLSTLCASIGLIILLGVYSIDDVTFSVWTNTYSWFLPLEYTFILCILISTILYNILYRTQYFVFDKKKSTVSIPNNYSASTFTAPWNEWTARIYEHNDTLEFSLVFIHIPTINIYNPVNNTKNINDLLSFWSFISMFMNKEIPHPQNLKFENNADYYSQQYDWKEFYDKLSIPDPWLEWLEELESNPKLDIVNNI